MILSWSDFFSLKIVLITILIWSSNSSLTKEKVSYIRSQRLDSRVPFWGSILHWRAYSEDSQTWTDNSLHSPKDSFKQEQCVQFCAENTLNLYCVNNSHFNKRWTLKWYFSIFLYSERSSPNILISRSSKLDHKCL